MSRFSSVRLLLIALAAATAVLVACDGEEDSATPTATATEAVATAAATATAAPTEAAPTPEAAPVLPATVTGIDGAVQVTDVSRVVVLNGDLTEVVYALGMGDSVVGADVSATYPPEAREKQNIGYQARLNAEGIISLNPTLILGSETAGPPEVIEQIKTLGIPVVLLPDVASIDGVATKIQSVADALGVPERGRALAVQTQAEIDEAIASAAAATEHPKVAFLYLRGAQTQMMAGEGSRADILIEAAGGVDAGTEAGISEYVPITPEALVTANPDVILVMSAGLESVGGVDGVLAIPGIAETTAGANAAVVAFDDQYLLGFGPRTGALLKELIAAIHPSLA